MNKNQAISAMMGGKKVTHKHFTPDEWMTLQGNTVVFEDGCSCTAQQLWVNRNDDSWNEGWSLHS